MTEHSWVQEFAGAITVCDRQGIILAMNDKAVETFRDQGGRALIGTNLLDCHPEPSRTTVQEMLDSGRPNVYTIGKVGRKKLIYQTPWYEGGQYRGLLELALEIPAAMPHFVREP
jgi:transcriptional regulator with PAS, ATPase and Fis domain